MVGLSCTMTALGSTQTTPKIAVATDAHQVNAEALEREVRRVLPAGSSLATVQDFLAKRGLGFSFEAQSMTAFAIARNLQGSTGLLNKSLAFKFHFNSEFRLKSIDAEVLYTGP